MADPFLGMFDGVNNGLDDLGLASSLGSHGSSTAQMQHSNSFPGFQSQSPSNTNQPKLQHFDERSSGSPFLPPSQKLQHFDDPLLSSSPQRFHTLQSPSQQQFSDYRSPSQVNMCWPRGQTSRSSPNYSGFTQGSEQPPFRQPFGYGFSRPSSPRLQHFANQSPMNSSPDRFTAGPSQSPRLQHPGQSSSASFSGSSPKGSSPKTMETPQQQKHNQISPQQAAFRHLQGSEGNKQQIDLGAQSRLQHLVSGDAVDMDQGKALSSQGEGSFPYNPFPGGPLQPKAVNQNLAQTGYSSQQFQNSQFPAFNGGMQSGVESKEMYAPGNQQTLPTSQQQAGYPFTNLQITDPQQLMQVKTSALLLQMQRIQQQIQQMREMGQPAQMQQLQYQFQRLYQFYAMQQRQMQSKFQQQNFDQMRFLQQQRQQEKANRIAVEAMAKAALHSVDGLPPMPGFPSMAPGQRLMGNQTGNTGMVDLSRHSKTADPIHLGPSIVSKPAPMRNTHTSRYLF